MEFDQAWPTESVCGWHCIPNQARCCCRPRPIPQPPIFVSLPIMSWSGVLRLLLPRSGFGQDFCVDSLLCGSGNIYQLLYFTLWVLSSSSEGMIDQHSRSQAWCLCWWTEGQRHIGLAAHYLQGSIWKPPFDSCKMFLTLLIIPCFRCLEDQLR